MNPPNNRFAFFCGSVPDVVATLLPIGGRVGLPTFLRKIASFAAPAEQGRGEGKIITQEMPRIFPYQQVIEGVTDSHR
jgi:hypothetical protein